MQIHGLVRLEWLLALHALEASQIVHGSLVAFPLKARPKRFRAESAGGSSERRDYAQGSSGLALLLFSLQFFLFCSETSPGNKLNNVR